MTVSGREPIGTGVGSVWTAPPDETVGLIGHPVGHSLSPAIHAAAFAAAGLNWHYVLRDVAPVDLAATIDSLRAEDWRGFNVTLPHKQAIIPLLDTISEVARRAGAVNTVVASGGRLIGENTDVAGFGLALRAAGWRPEDYPGSVVLVLGAGGAARAAISWLAASRLSVTVAGRTPARAADLARAMGRNGMQVTAVPDPVIPDELVARCRLVVQATSSGRDTPQWLPFRFDALPRAALCFDLNYARSGQTPFCAAAIAAGLTATDGLRMLVEQAAAAFSRWTGLPAPLAAMLAAVARSREES